MSPRAVDEVYAERDERCLRGLATRVHFPARLEVTRLEAPLTALLGPVVRGTERLGEREVVRLIRQFVVEARLGERSGQLMLHNRACTTPESRKALEARVISLISAVLGEAAAA